MKAIVLNRNGEAAKLSYVENRPVPKPGYNEIRVKVKAVGLNPVDYKLADGWGT